MVVGFGRCWHWGINSKREEIKTLEDISVLHPNAQMGLSKERCWRDVETWRRGGRGEGLVARVFWCVLTIQLPMLAAAAAGAG